MSANERMDLLVSGIVDPRWISNAGVVSSKMLQTYSLQCHHRAQLLVVATRVL
ncbi:MAG: hypothetical protein L6V95_09415 [Candidatus Melainabacteria bacterium]|nr:MAG: hypothetical protein L6V95_09415 [Candidatus Melainabacteria bacterium]